MPRTGSNIYKRKDGRWEGRYVKSKSPSGKTSYGYVYAKTYREAKQKLIDAVSANRLFPGIELSASHDSFKIVATEWLSSLQPVVKESTANKYWNLLNLYILPEIGKYSIHEISHEILEKYCNHLLIRGGRLKQGLSSKTVSDVLSVVRSVLRYAAMKGNRISYDAKSIKIKRHQKEIRILSRYEQEQLCQYLYTNLNPSNIGILLCLFTGLRVGELCALRWEDISLSDQTIHIHKTMQRVQNRDGSEQKTRVIVTEPKSVCSIRTIPIPNELLHIISSYRTSGNGVGYFLTNSSSKYLEPRTMQNRFRFALQESCIEPANYHALRHTFATRCIELGFDLKSLSEILGHANVNITMNRYVHPSMELKKENMQRLSELFSVK